jgi:hypothetical protein
MECKFIKHGIALQYDQVVKPCCEWRSDDAWPSQNHISQVDLGTWHQSPQVVKFAKQLEDNVWPTPCTKCADMEGQGRADSIRGNGNQSYKNYQKDDITLEIRPGSVCNFACQTCWPAASSRVADYHARAGLVNIKDVDSNSFDNFDFLLPIKHRIRDVVLLGGEPFYDKSCLKFLSWAQQNLSANFMMFTNGSRIDFDFIKSYRAKLTLIVSLDAVGRPAEYIRYGTDWAQVIANYRLVRTLPNVETRVNITCSIYNYYYIEELIELLVQDWPAVVSFGLPNQEYFRESVVPLQHRKALIDSLERAVGMINSTDIESGQKSNAVNALSSIIQNLHKLPWSESEQKKLTNFVDQMDRVKQISMKDYCQDLYNILQ